MKKDFIFIICFVISAGIIIITALFYPRVNDFNNTTPSIIFMAGIILGLGLGLVLTKKEKQKEIMK